MTIHWRFGLTAWVVGFECVRCGCGNLAFVLHLGPVSVLLHREGLLPPAEQTFVVKPFTMPEFSDN